MITRQIGKLIRGSATPFQIIAATVIASGLAFLPGLAVAPGLLLAWLALLVIVNANLFLAGLVGLVAKLVALLLAPVSFALGRWLLDSPLRGLFETLVNAPVFAWFGFEYPLVTGGQAVGLAFGLITGIFVVALTRRTWRKLAALEKDSAAFQAWNAKRWVRATSFIFVGGLKGKQSYEALAARRIGNPVRLLGVVLVALLAVLGYVGAKFFDDAIVTAALRSGLESANGATVDLERASLDLAAGSLTLDGLALCDPDNVATNLFAAKNVAAKVSTSDLLRKRATIDLVTITAATQGEARPFPGQRFAPPPEEDSSWNIKLPDAQSIDDLVKNAPVWKERLASVRRWLQKFSGDSTETAPVPAGETGPTYEEILRKRATIDLVTITAATQGEARPFPGQRFAPPPEEDSSWNIKLPDAQSIDDLVKNAPVWKERLASVRRWLQKFSGDSTENAPVPAGETGPTYEEILRERIRREGYSNFRDDSLVQKAPTLLIRRIEAADVRSTAMPGEVLSLVAENLSTQPQLTSAAPSLSVRSASGVFVAKVALDPLLSAATQAHVEFLWKGLSVDALGAQLKSGDKPLPVSGGTVDVSAVGTIGFVDSRLPLTLTLRDTNVTVGGSKAERVPELPFTVEVRGPIDQPTIAISPDAWKKAVTAVAKGELKRRLTGELDKVLGGDGAASGSGDKKDAARGLLEGLLGGQKSKDAEKKDPPAPAPAP